MTISRKGRMGHIYNFLYENYDKTRGFCFLSLNHCGECAPFERQRDQTPRTDAFYCHERCAHID